MYKLANSNVAQLFTVSAADWTVINKRVGSVLAAQRIESQILPYLPSYPNLLLCCKLWQQSTFDNMLGQSQALVVYADVAIAGFTSLNDAVKELIQTGGDVPIILQLQTQALLKNLADNTFPLVSAFDTIATQVLSFLNYNKAIDQEVAAHKSQLGNFWEPIGAYIISLEHAAGLLTGVWRAITDDLRLAIAADINVDLPFLESLDIEAAIVNWRNAQTEARNFPGLTAEQKQYWTNPFNS